MGSLLKRGLICGIFLSFAFSIVNAQSAPAAQDVLKMALVKANTENKKVFLMFQASWCGWCHNMDKSMSGTDCERLFKNNYVVCHIIVRESDEKKYLENPGAEEMLAKYHGEKSDIPFWLIFDRNGNLLADSQIRPNGASMDTPGRNVGCPSEPDEIAYFVKVLKQTSNLNEDELSVIKSKFVKK